MAVLARHFGYKPVTQTYNFPGYTEHGARLIVQDNYITPFQGDSLVPGQEFSGFEWTMGPDEDRFHSIICYTAEIGGELPEAFNTEGTIDTENYAPGDGVTDVSGYGFDGTARKLAFKGVPNQADFLGIANELGIGTFANDAEAVAAINNTTLGAWTNYDGVNSNQDDEGGNKENPTDFYYEVTACGGSTNYILKTTTELTRFSAYVTSNVMFAEGLAFDSETYVVVRSTSAQAHQLLDQAPVLGTCEA